MEAKDDYFSKVRCNWLRRPKAIVPIRDQGRCAACYAFAAMDCISTVYHNKFKEEIVLSTQEIVDFLPIRYPPRSDKEIQADKSGCYPGNLTKAFTSAREYGCYLEEDYKYTGIRDEKCSEPENAKYKIKIESIGFVPKSAAEKDILKLIARHPLAGSVPLVESLMEYDGKGIYMGPTDTEIALFEEDKSTGTVREHAILVIGYGEEDGTKYYLIKNSWGSEWGKNGYAKVIRGIVHRLSYPINPSRMDLEKN